MTVSYHARCYGTLAPDYACQRDGISTGTPACQNICGAWASTPPSPGWKCPRSARWPSTPPCRSPSSWNTRPPRHTRCAPPMQRARQAAAAARSRYLSVDPANRLVADALEADSNAWSRDLADAEDDYQRATRQAAVTLDGSQRYQVPALASDLPALWRNPATSMKDRKRLIRLLVTDVTLLKDSDTITAHVRLPGGQDHTLTVPRPLTAWEAHTTPAETVTLIDELLGEHPFDEIAAILSERGITGGWGRPYTVPSLAALCRARGIPDHSARLRAAGYLTAAETAARLGTAIPTVNRWQPSGLIDGHRIDGRGTCLFPPGQQRPAPFNARAARDRAASGLLSARQLGAQLGVTGGTVTRWHHLGLIDAAGHDHRGHPLYRAGHQKPSRTQITAAGLPAAHRDEELTTGGQRAARLGVARSTIYKWYWLGLINAVTTDYRGPHLYRSGQQAPNPAQITAARASSGT